MAEEPEDGRLRDHRERAGGDAVGRSERRQRLTGFIFLATVCAALAVGYAWWATARRASSFEDEALPPIASLSDLEESPTGEPSGPPPGDERLEEEGPTGPGATPPSGSTSTLPERREGPDSAPLRPTATLLFRHTGLDDSFGVASVQRPGTADDRRRATPLRCDRVHFAVDRGVCLTTDRFYTTHAIIIFDRDFRPLHRLPLNGVPSRARVAPNGRLAAVTVFVAGHSYADEGFSTETSIIDTDIGERRVANLEEFQISRQGVRIRAVDLNVWGITFSDDSDRFFATLGTGDATSLIEGRVSTRRAVVVADGVECPSLSPDGTRVAFKRRVGDGSGFVWRLHVMDLGTHQVTALSETRHVDDQVEWLDDRTILYAIPDPLAPTPMVTDVWQVAADGSGQPELFLSKASSPAVVRSVADFGGRSGVER